MKRRDFLAGLGAAALPAFATHADDRADAARQLIAQTTTVDLHSHAGGFISERSRRRPVSGPMREGGMAVVCFAVVSDSPTHKVMPEGRIRPFRSPEPGELYAWTQGGFRRLHELIRNQDLALVTDAASLRAAGARNPSAIVATEGGDFLEGSADRVDEAYERWKLRHLQIVHYRPNELGDIQTEARVHDGLTEAGAAVIRRCNQRGVVVDVAHATYEVVKRAASVTQKPLVLSHTALNNNPSFFSRTISRDHARIVAETGGVIGVWPPRSSFRSLREVADGMARLADAVGVDHVGFGSDMQGIPGGTVFESYDLLPELAQGLLATGFSPADAGKVLGGNYRRVFEATVAA